MFYEETTLGTASLKSIDHKTHSSLLIGFKSILKSSHLQKSDSVCALNQ